MTAWEPVVGLEVHAQLLTATKLFCGCSTRFGDPPNSHTCEVCLGLPGVLPVLNRQAVELGVTAALALDCKVHRESRWSRKNYFYPDLPKGYQVTQYDRPYATGGHLRVDGQDGPRDVRIRRIHLEEDAGKSIHDEAVAGQRSLVDFNRAGVPLVEIVTEPDLRSAAEAAAYMRALRRLLRHLEVCDGNLEEGSLRCDANVSLRPAGAAALGTRTELKNINSFRNVQAAIEYEIARQRAVLEGGGTVVQETRLWDAQARETRPMRSKEEAHDYRYFPEPDLPDLVIDPIIVARLRQSLPELPAARIERYVTMGLADHDARVLCEEPRVASFFERVLARLDRPRVVANWVVNEVLREVKGGAAGHARLTDDYAAQLAEVIALTEDGVVSGSVARALLAEVGPGVSPRALVEERGLRQVSDASSLEPLVDEVLVASPESVAKYRAGKTGLLGFFVGQVVKRTGGKANPKLVAQMVERKLGGPGPARG